MNISKINDTKQTIGFFATTIAWAFMNIANAIYIVIEDGKATDSGVIIFWSGLFIFLTWVLFLIWPIEKLNHSGRIFKTIIFIPLSILYAGIAYAIIVGSLFQSFELVLMFFPQALLVGFIFGLAYINLIKSKKVVDLLFGKPIIKMGFFLSPLLFLGLFLYLFPLVAPNIAYRFVPDAIRDNIVAKTIPKYSVGDEIEPLKKDLPGYLAHIKNGKGNMFATMEDFAFVLQVNCGKIIRLEYGKNQSEFDGTVYGKMTEKPCP
tara:strand:+ start:59 stop:847 length:789 start_codon:yes stop_codon:yes gene_type:complete